MSKFLKDFVDFFTPKEPKTVTVRVPLELSEDYCEVTYMAKNEVAKLVAESVPQHFAKLKDKEKCISPSDTLLKIEEKLDLNRHGVGNEPAFTHHCVSWGKTIHEHWKYGCRHQLFKVHTYTIESSGKIRPHSNERPKYFIEDDREIAYFTANYSYMKTKEGISAKKALAAEQQKNDNGLSPQIL